MKRREFSKRLLVSGIGMSALGATATSCNKGNKVKEGHYLESERNIPIRDFDVVVAGGGTSGVFAAVAAARTGAKTAIIEGKGYTGGIAVEGGTALHSFYNLWKPFGVKKQQVVKGMPSEFIDILYKMGACSGHGDVVKGFDYDSVCTAIDTEVYKYASMKYLKDAGVQLFLNSFVRGAVVDDKRVVGAIVESRSGRELFKAKTFIDSTGYGDLAAYVGAECREINDYGVVNSFGIGNVNVEAFHNYLENYDAVGQLAYGRRSGKDNQIIRIAGKKAKLPEAFRDEINKLGVAMVTTTVHDNYFMFIKTGMKLSKNPIDRDTVSAAELTIRENQFKCLEAFKKHIPGMEKAFMARTAPSLVVRRARHVKCDYDLSIDEIVGAKHFEDEVYNYGFHDNAPRLQVGRGETYGMPYRGLCVSGLENLYAIGMMITSNHAAHMSTRNTVSCMAQGQAAGTAAALCARANIGIRDLPFSQLKNQLINDDVYFV